MGEPISSGGRFKLDGRLVSHRCRRCGETSAPGVLFAAVGQLVRAADGALRPGERRPVCPARGCHSADVELLCHERERARNPS